MGHERADVLPSTTRWRELVEEIEALTGGEFAVGALASKTLKLVRTRLQDLERDPASLAAFRYLVELAVAASEEGNVAQAVPETATDQVTPLQLSRVLRARLAETPSQPEYRELANAAAADALTHWYQQHRARDIGLFEDFNKASDTWSKLGRGSGFCELSRLFFGKIVERYLRYFLEREAAQAVPSVSHRDQLRTDLEEHVDELSQHAFETARITQSFAAGWFNKHMKHGMPPPEKIAEFFNHALAKLRDELIQEGVEK